MSTVQTWQTESISSDATLAVAEAMGRKLQGGEVIELVSELGGGKTTFVKGLVKGLGSSDKVTSPSFTLSNQYKAGQHTIYHFDFHRLAEPGIMRNELTEILADPQAIIVIEWASIIKDLLPTKRIVIHIRVTSESSREFTATYPSTRDYLFTNT